MRAFRAGQIESGKMPPYISICSRASRITSKTIFFLIEKEATEFVKKILRSEPDFQSFILHNVYRSFSRLIDDEKILCRYYIRHNGGFTIEVSMSIVRAQRTKKIKHFFRSIFLL